MKRIFLFLATNAAVLVVISIVLHVFGVNQYLTGTGIDYQKLLVFSAIVGFTGSIFSLLISKPMAKMSTGAKVIDGTEGAEQRWLVQTVHQLADRAGIGHPDVAMYEGAANAFATGAFKNNALVAVSSGLLRSMSRDEVEAVLGHEVAHIANGDMVTLTLIQGVLNTFVVFLSRVVGHFLDRAVFRSNRGNGPGYFITVIILQVVFSIFASMIVAWFSRRREFRADAGSAQLLNSPGPMISALTRLGGLEPGELPESVQTSGITNRAGFMALFSTHPPIEQRIAALRKRQ
ncbi:MAG: heat shock protein HtpX [Gammaproteobacteria bacterium]|jgi:heat shock protein HtpX